MISRKVQIDGRIYPLEANATVLNVLVDSALLHIGVDGMIGAFRSPTDNSVSQFGLIKKSYCHLNHYLKICVTF